MIRSSLISFMIFILSFSSFSQVTGMEEAVRAQSTDTIQGWKHGGKFTLNFSQVSFTNWSAGGQNSVSGIGNLTLFLNHKGETSEWSNNLEIGYGMQKLDKDITKTDDKLYFTSKYGRQFKGNWYWSGLLDFKTQMAKGYSSDDASLMISNWMAPAYLFFSLGVDLKPGENLSIFMAPVTSKNTFVLDKALSDSGSFGLDPGKTARSEFGGYIKFFFKHQIMENITFQTKLDLFSNYLNNPQNIDVDWELLLDMKVNKFISARLTTNLIYDDDIKIPYDSTGDGVLDSKGPKVQFKELIGIGLSFGF